MQESVERRSEFRFPVEVPVEYFKPDDSRILSYALDLSKGGTFISSDDPLGMGGRFGLDLTIPVDYESSKIFGTEGTVAWNKVQPFKSESNGMGVKFIEPLPESLLLNALAHNYRKLIKETKELKKSREQLRNLSTYLQSVREQERTHIAGEIHDDLGQSLTALKMDIYWLAKRLPKDQKPLLEKLEAMEKFTGATIKTAQRISTELRPSLLDHLGLVATIKWQAEEFQNRTGIRYKITIDPEDITLDEKRSTSIFRIFQETLTNVARHARATRVEVSLKEKAGTLELKVRDNGNGITKEQISDHRSFGLLEMRERANALAGEAEIKGAKGKGTTVMVRIPVEKEGET